MKILKNFLMVAVSILFISCEKTSADPIPTPEPTPGPEEPEEPADTTVTSDDVELSYWVDCDMLGYHRRGYWYDYTKYSSESAPDPSYVKNGARMLVQTYNANLIYVFYHRQFEIAKAKEVFQMWKSELDELGVTMVPTVLLQDYSDGVSGGNLNFSDDELTDLAIWCNQTLKTKEFGIFDVYSRQTSGSLQDKQLAVLKNAIGDKIVFVGFQPGVNLNSNFCRAVEDDWTAECQGNTNELWSNPVGGQNVGKKLLTAWVKQRVNGEKRPVTWDLIPVAWDYEKTTAKDQYGYVCPGDNALYNDPPIPGRLFLCKELILSLYPNQYENERFGGFSCDLTILAANSQGCQMDKTHFYKAIRAGKAYDGYFSSAIVEIAEVYQAVKDEFIAKYKTK